MTDSFTDNDNRSRDEGTRGRGHPDAKSRRGKGRGPGGGSGRGHGKHGSGRGRGRAPRGDVRSAILLLLAEEPMHGYQLMRAIADRTQHAWRPSPGVVYPTISQLEDEGLVTVTDTSGRRVVALTDSGRRQVADLEEAGTDPFAGHESDAPGVDLRGQLEQLHGAVREIGRNGTDAQREAAAETLAAARRSIYLLLAGEPVGRADGESEGDDA
jgi:DNA-binding PadR family transcriptional regulator